MDQKWVDMLREWSGDEHIRIILIIVVAWLLIEFIQHAVPWCAKKIRPSFRFYTIPWIPLLRLLVILTAVTFIVPLIITPTRENILTLIGASALAVGFALKDYISSVFGGIIMLIERPFRIGDWIETGGSYGEVVNLGLRALDLLTVEDNVITVPYNTLLNAQIINSTDGQRHLMCIIDFFVAPNHDIRRVREILTGAAAASEYLHADKPIAVVLAAKPFGLHYKVKAYPADARDQFLFSTDVTERGQAALAEIGLSLVSAPVALHV